MTKSQARPPRPGAAKPGDDRRGQTARRPSRGRRAAANRGRAGSAADPLGADGESSRISRVDAQGHVVVWNATDVGRGDYGVYNADTGIVTLLGNVTITRGQDVVRGQYAVVDLNTNVSRMMTVAAKPGAPAPRVEGLLRAPGRRPPAPGSGAPPRQAAAKSAAGNCGPQGRMPP